MRDCWLNVASAAGVTFLALANGAGKLETYLWLSGRLWIISGTVIAIWWAYEMYCKGPQND